MTGGIILLSMKMSAFEAILTLRLLMISMVSLRKRHFAKSIVNFSFRMMTVPSLLLL